MKKLYSIVCIVTLAVLFPFKQVKAGVETIYGGSYIINMGITPQTKANALKPYGLIYELLNTHQIPIKWVINTSKLKDGIDFIHNGITYKGGTFIIPTEYRTPAINSVIAAWEAQGVIGNTTVTFIDVEVFITLRHAPIWTLDKASGAIAVKYFINAGIPPSAHGGSSSSGWKLPSQLGACDDIFAMPHADPTWATHNNLYYWNMNFKGNIWSSCHAVSVMENLTNPGNTTAMNFLSTTGLVNFTLHNNASPSYNYNFPASPVMQFMSTLDAATVNGSEQCYLPKLGGNWRASTSIGTYDATQVNVPSLSPGEATIVAFGRAFGDANRGWVMYEAGHDHNKTSIPEANSVAAQRAFFNYSFYTAHTKIAFFNLTINNLPAVWSPGVPIAINFSTTPAIDLSQYTIQWSSSCGGTFTPNPDLQNVTFTPPNNFLGSCIVSITLVNACNRAVFDSRGIYIATVLPITVHSFNGIYKSDINSNILSWEELTADAINTYEIEKSVDGRNFYAIGLMASQNKATPCYYSFTDDTVINELNYYRLKMYCKDGKQVYSSILRLNKRRASKPVLSIAPNPVSDGRIRFEYYSLRKEIIEVNIVSTQGSIIVTKKILANVGSNSFTIAGLPQLAAGIYAVIIKTGNGILKEKLLIENK